MRHARSVAVFMLLAALTMAQDTGEPPRDLLSMVQSERSLAMFVTAVQTSGMARMLREEGPFTVFALSNRAFASLPKEDREELLANHGAMRFLLGHYIARGNIRTDDMADLMSARTVVGVKLRTDIRNEGSYVNGAKVTGADIRCENGMIHVLDSLDPGLVHDAVAMSRSIGKPK